MGRSSRRGRRWLIAIGLTVLLLLGTAFATLRVAFNGPALADKLASLLNKGRRGRIEIGSVEWEVADLKKVITGGWVRITVRDVRVWDDCTLPTDDPETLRLGDPNRDCTDDDKPDPIPGSKRRPRKLLLWTPTVDAELDIHAALFGNHDLTFRHVVLHGGEALVEQTREPYPLHAYNHTTVTIASAFYPRMKAGFRAGIYADSPPPIFDLRDIHVEGLNVTVDVSPSVNSDGTMRYGMAARLEGLEVAPALDDDSAYIHFDGRDPLVQKFYVRLAAKAKGGHVRLLDDGPREAFRIPHPGEQGFVWGKGRDDYYDLEIAEVDLSRLAQLPNEWPRRDYIANTLEVAATIKTRPCDGAMRPEDGAVVHLTGGLLDYWDRPYDGQWSFKIDAQNLGPTVRSCIKKTVGGDNLGGTITISGPFVALPRIALDLHDMDIDIPLSKKEEPVRLTLAKVQGWIDLVNEQGAIDQTKAIVKGGKQDGEALVSATFGLRPMNAQADLDILKPIDVGRFLPEKATKAVGPYLHGRLRVRGDIDEGFSLQDFDLALGSLTTEVVRVFGGQIFSKNRFDYTSINRVRFKAGRTDAIIQGRIVWDAKKDTFIQDVNIDGQAPDLDYWLKLFNLPVFATSAGGGGTHIHLTGPVNNPTVNVTTTLQGVPCLDNVAIDANYNGGIAQLTLSSGGLGGKLTGAGVIDMRGAIARIDGLHLSGKGLNGAKVCGTNGIVQGTIDTIEADVHGTIDPKRPAADWAALAKIYATAKKLSVLGDSYSDIAMCVNRPQSDDNQLCRRRAVGASTQQDCEDAKKNGACAVATAHRDAGGSLDATIANLKQKTTSQLAGQVQLEDIPLAVLDPWIGPDKIGGLFSANLALGGSLAPQLAPVAAGTINLLRSWVKDAFTGDAQLTVRPTTIGKLQAVQIQGRALADRVLIVATLGTEAPYPVDVQITGQRIEVDQFVDLSKQLGIAEPIQAWASGTISLHTELKPKTPIEPVVWVEITELEAILDHQSRDGRRVPLRFALVPGEPGQYAMSLRVTPSTLELACRTPGGSAPCPAKLSTPAGTVAIAGTATKQQMNLTAKGDLELDKLGPLFENQIDAIQGVIALDAILTGTFKLPTYSVELAVKDTATVRPAGSDTDLQFSGQIKLANGSLGFNQFVVRVKDARAGEAGELHVKGAIGLAGLKPDTWGVLIEGKLAGKMLLAIAPTAVSQAGGSANIDGDLVLSGHGPLPLVHGTIAFDAGVPFTIVPRGVRRELALVRGSVDIDTKDVAGHRSYTLGVGDDDTLTMTIDGEGRIEHVSGRVALKDGAPTDADIDLDAENVPYRSADRSLDLTLAGKDIHLALRNGVWDARGELAIVGGSYRRGFELTDQLKPAPPVAAPAKPWWDEYPSIGNATLDLTLDVRRFAVDNNIARIDFAGNGIKISGSPRDPRLEGSIRVAGRGEITLPLTRAKFTRTVGTIDFSPNERASNPRLDITSDAPDFHDLSGQQHVITMTFTGPLDQLVWDLRTNTGLDRSQTLNLLFFGRNPEQLRRSLGDQSIGSTPQNVETSTAPSTGPLDQVVKDVAGDWISSLLGSSLTKLPGLEVLRFELGFGSVAVHMRFKVLENLRLLGDAEQTIRGYTLNAGGELRTPWYQPLGWLAHRPLASKDDRVTFEVKALSKIYSDPADQVLNIQDVQGKVVYRLFIP